MQRELAIVDLLAKLGRYIPFPIMLIHDFPVMSLERKWRTSRRETGGKSARLKFWSSIAISRPVQIVALPLWLLYLVLGRNIPQNTPNLFFYINYVFSYGISPLIRFLHISIEARFL